MKSRLLLFALIVFCFVSCKKKLGEYIYVDAAEILHTDRECSCICKFNSGTAPITRYSVKGVRRGLWQHVCSVCVTDECFDKIEEQVEFNIEAEERGKVFLQKLYDKLIEVGEDQWYSFDSFYSYVQNKDNFRRLVIQLEQKGYDIIEWIEEDSKEEYGIVDLDSIMQNLD